MIHSNPQKYMKKHFVKTTCNVNKLKCHHLMNKQVKLVFLFFLS